MLTIAADPKHLRSMASAGCRAGRASFWRCACSHACSLFLQELENAFGAGTAKEREIVEKAAGFGLPHDKICQLIVSERMGKPIRLYNIPPLRNPFLVGE